MARGDKGSLLDGFHGRLNDFIVIKQRNGKPVICFYPKGKRIKWTANQVEHRQDFKSATWYARHAIKNPEKLAFYKAREHDGINAYNLAIADYMHNPSISSIDIRKARKKDEYLIRVHATDDFIVTRVQITLTDLTGKSSREDAIQFRKTDTWLYRIGSEQLSTILTIKAVAYDYPGHNASLEYHISPEENLKRLPHS
jgi:hypothetical protein